MSTALLQNNPSPSKERYEEDGFVLLPGVLDDALMQEAKAHVEHTPKSFPRSRGRAPFCCAAKLRWVSTSTCRDQLS